MRSAGSDRHGQLRGAHHRGPRAGWSSPRPGRAAPRGPASSAHWPTAAPPARRPSPPGRGDRQSAAPAGRPQSPWPGAASRLGPAVLPISVITSRGQVVHCHQKGAGGGRPAPRCCSRPCLATPTNATPVFAPAPAAGFHSSAGPTAREDGRRATRSRFRAVARRGRFQGPAAVLAADDRKEYHVSTNFEAAHQSRHSAHCEAGGGADKMPPATDAGQGSWSRAAARRLKRPCWRGYRSTQRGAVSSRLLLRRD